MNGELKKDFFFVEEGNQERIMQFVLSLYKNGLKKFEGYENFKSIQIITPSKKGIVRNKRNKQKNTRTCKSKQWKNKREASTAERYLEKETA